MSKPGVSAARMSGARRDGIRGEHLFAEIYDVALWGVLLSAP